MAPLTGYRAWLARRCYYCVYLYAITLVLTVFVIIFGFPEIFGRNVYTWQKREGVTVDVKLVLQKRSITTSRSREECTVLSSLSLGKARFDNRRLVRIYDFHYTGKDWESLRQQYDVCLATQTSIERMYWVSEMLDKWTAPISLAVYITSNEEWLILNMFTCYLISCHPRFQQQVSVHVVVPSKIGDAFRMNLEWKHWNMFKNKTSELYWKGRSCPDSWSYMNYLLKTFPTKNPEKLRFKEVYPQNHLRNLARKACPTAWTYSVDVDIIPRERMADMLQQFYQELAPCPKCAFVIPTFEVKETEAFPATKLEMVHLFDRGVARQFHGKYYSPGHKATDYPRWISTNLDDGDAQVSHGILTNATLYYEPFYVSSDNIPPFDERFVGYGYTRSTQFKAASMAGWNFSVLTPLFSVHWGLQTAKTIFSPKKNGIGRNVRYEQIQENSKLYKKVVQEMKLDKKLGLT